MLDFRDQQLLCLHTPSSGFSIANPLPWWKWHTTTTKLWQHTDNKFVMNAQKLRKRRHGAKHKNSGPTNTQTRAQTNGPNKTPHKHVWKTKRHTTHRNHTSLKHTPNWCQEHQQHRQTSTTSTYVHVRNIENAQTHAHTHPHTHAWANPWWIWHTCEHQQLHNHTWTTRTQKWVSSHKQDTNTMGRLLPVDEEWTCPFWRWGGWCTLSGV